MERLQQSPTSFDAYKLAQDVIKVRQGEQNCITTRARSQMHFAAWGAGMLPDKTDKV
jgi:hypothetical protein